jgi:hypothetical protein
MARNRLRASRAVLTTQVMNALRPGPGTDCSGQILRLDRYRKIRKVMSSYSDIASRMLLSRVMHGPPRVVCYYSLCFNGAW